MTYINKACVDAGTVNCPCPLAETGDCLICSRLAGRDACDCSWAGVCVYNEFIQNDKVIRSCRNDMRASIVNKRWYGDDLLVLTLDTGKGMSLEALRPGSFVFLGRPGNPSYANVPVSVMKADPAKGHIFLAVKVIGSKTRMISEAEDLMNVRGVYRNGLLGRGLQGMFEDVQSAAGGTQCALHEENTGAKHHRQRRRWLILTKGIGFAPAVNLLKWADGKVDADMLIDTEKINEAVVNDYLGDSMKQDNMHARFESLGSAGVYNAQDYDRIIILASDYYIKTLAWQLDVPENKLVFSNNFHMCCGEGICGACGHVDSQGHFSKMCKCREVGDDMQIRRDFIV